jgi:hypothetical protein
MTIDELNRKLLEAAKRSDIEGMMEALKQGAEVNSRDGWGRMAMMEVVSGPRGGRAKIGTGQRVFPPSLRERER